MRWRLAVALAALILVPQRSPAQDYSACRAPGVTPPKAANQHTAGEYPLLSVMLKEEGTTTLGFVIQTDGVPTAVTVVESSGSLRLDDASVAAVTQLWRYQPALSAEGKPIACPWKAQVRWVLRGATALPKELAEMTVTMRPEDYPPEARSRGEEGTTVVMVVLFKGMERPLAVVMESSGHRDLDEASLRIVMERLKLAPAEIDGKSVPTMAVVAIVWSLGAASPPAAPPAGG